MAKKEIKTKKKECHCDTVKKLTEELFAKNEQIKDLKCEVLFLSAQNSIFLDDLKSYKSQLTEKEDEIKEFERVLKLKNNEIDNLNRDICSYKHYYHQTEIKLSLCKSDRDNLALKLQSKKWWQL